MVASATAASVEFAFRSLTPLPYSPRAADLVLSVLLFALTIVPALLCALLAPRLARTALLLAAVPFGLLALDLFYLFERLSNFLLVALAVDVAVALGAILLRRVSPRTLAAAALACLVLAGGMRWVPRGNALADARGPSVLLVVLDTAAAAHLSAFGYDRGTTPRLEQVARQSLVYRRAISPAPWTIPAHASIFSGRFPSELGFNAFGFTSASAGSIADDLRRSGRPTFGITANPILFSQPMLGGGFDALWGARRLTRPFMLRLADRLLFHRSVLARGERVSDLALDWVDRVAPRGEPWFLFLNYIDPHTPYDPPRQDLERFAAGIDPGSIDPADFASGRRLPSPETTTTIRALYDAEISATDRALGRLLDGLERRGFDAKNLLLIVTADHGEAIGEQGLFGHLRGLPDSVLHVPLVVSGPGVTPGVVWDPVQTVQLRATIRRLLGLDDLPCAAPALPPWGVAPSLVVTEHREVPFYTEAFPALVARKHDPWSGDWFAVERDGTKAIFDGHGHGVSYRIRDDPDERHPLPLEDATALLRDYDAWQRAACPSRTGG